ncbi:unnamed protein product, partial [Iphiclides podalirius]
MQGSLMRTAAAFSPTVTASSHPGAISSEGAKALSGRERCLSCGCVARARTYLVRPTSCAYRLYLDTPRQTVPWILFTVCKARCVFIEARAVARLSGRSDGTDSRCLFRRRARTPIRFLCVLFIPSSRVIHVGSRP